MDETDLPVWGLAGDRIQEAGSSAVTVAGCVRLTELVGQAVPVKLDKQAVSGSEVVIQSSGKLPPIEKISGPLVLLVLRTVDGNRILKDGNSSARKCACLQAW